MTFEVLSDVNWIAVLVATIVWFVLGAGWYIAPPIATRWARAGGIEIPEDAGPDPKVFVLTLVVYFVVAVGTAMLAVATGTDTAGEGAVLGAIVGGVLVCAAAISAIYDQKPEPLNYFWINGFFNLVALIIVGVIIGAWN
jgi:MFS family permease